MPELVLVISIGPVQGFVQTSRKARDLAASSEILSRLAFEAARAVDSLAGGGARVVPGGSLDPAASYANKVVAVVPSARCSDVADGVVAAIRRTLRSMADEVADTRRIPTLDRALLHREIDAFLEVTWAASPLGPSFGEARSEAERALAARKHLRDFAPWVGVAGRSKTSSDGAFEEVLGADSKEARASLKRMFGEAMFAPLEFLDAIGFVRRFRRQGPQPSLAEVATAPFVASARSRDLRGWNELERAWENATAGIKDLELPEGLIWGRSGLAHALTEAADGGAGLLPKREAETRAEQFDRALRPLIGGPGQRPSPYLAIVVGDGDSVGDYLSKLQDRRQHEAAAVALAETAVRMRALERDDGSAGTRVIYAGGDDLLALVPVDHAIPFADAARKAFAATEWPATGEPPRTMSVGIAVRHVRDSLQEGLAMARRAEARAKGAGRNRLGLTVDRRGGAPWDVVLPWDDDPKAWFGEAVAWLKGLEVPRGVAYELRTAASDLQEVSDPAVIRGEVERILGRKRRRDGGAVDRAIVDALLRTLPDQPVADDADGLAGRLLVAGHFATYSQGAP